MTVPRLLQTLSTRCKMYKASLLCNKCINEDFRSRVGLMGPLSGVVILKILYRFGNEDLII